ncbi:MAG: DUF6515 family protein [Steroidobacteraceae bacterium]
MKNASVWIRACGTLVVGALLSAGSAPAQDRHEGNRHEGDRRGGHQWRAPEHMDGRYAHNHYYPDRGVWVGGVPGRPFVYDRSGGRYYYSGGIWYAARGPRFVVVGAPIGLFVPVLPPFYTTLWIGGAPYYYANDTYYLWSQAQSGYEVVDPPNDQGASTEAPQPPPPQGDDLYIYPQNGQSTDQQASDKYECHKWASSQTGFDPTQSGGGVPPEQLGGKRADYQRAMRACLQGRGYSAR